MFIERFADFVTDPTVGALAANAAIRDLCETWDALVGDGQPVPDERILAHVQESIDALQAFKAHIERPKFKVLAR
jgi:hypothetical protein